MSAFLNHLPNQVTAENSPSLAAGPTFESLNNLSQVDISFPRDLSTTVSIDGHLGQTQPGVFTELNPDAHNLVFHAINYDRGTITDVVDGLPAPESVTVTESAVTESLASPTVETTLGTALNTAAERNAQFTNVQLRAINATTPQADPDAAAEARIRRVSDTLALTI